MSEILIKHNLPEKRIDSAGLVCCTIWSKEASEVPRVCDEQAIRSLIKNNAVIIPSGGEPASMVLSNIVSSLKVISKILGIAKNISNYYTYGLAYSH